MKFTEQKLAGVYVVDLEPFMDDRGFFARAWNGPEFATHGLTDRVMQMNLSLSTKRGTVRGMHRQIPPHQEAKFVRCIRGAIYDVVLDLRHGSPTFGQWCGAELTPENYRAMYVPEGCAHGFQSLADDAEVLYLVSKDYAPDYERGVRYNDPQFDIQWPLPVSVISEKDRTWPDYRPEPAEASRE